MSDVVQRAISSSVSDWLQAHPAVFELMQWFLWASNHPIISVVIFIIVVAIAFSLIKAIGRLIEIITSSILKAPFKLLQVLFSFIFHSFGKVGGLAFKQLNKSETLALQDAKPQSIEQNKQQRLAEISARLEAIGQEQNELLQEVAAILSCGSNKN